MVEIKKKKLTGEELIEFARFDGIGLSKVSLTGLRDLDASQLQTFFELSGSTLRELKLTLKAGQPLEGALELDWAALTPSLRRLELRNVPVPSSLFGHPTLERLRVIKCDIHGDNVQIGAASDGAATSLERLVLDETTAHVEKLSIGPRSDLELLELRLRKVKGPFFDELDLASCPSLAAIRVLVERELAVVMRGTFPALDEPKAVLFDPSLGCDYRFDLRYLREPEWLRELLG